MGDVRGTLLPPCNFDLSFELTLTGEDAAWTKRVWVDEHYYHKDYLPDDGAWYLDMDSFDQWNYTTADGTELLLAMNAGGFGFLICEQQDAFLVVTINGNNTGSAYPQPGQVPGKEALEQMAEVFDFALKPTLIDRNALQPALDAAEAEYQAQHTIEAPVYAGFEAYILDSSIWLGEDTLYTFHDLDGDGQLELLLGNANGPYTATNTYLSLQDGQVQVLYCGGVLCEDGVVMSYLAESYSIMESRQYWRHSFPSSEENDSEFLGYVYRRSDGTWKMAIDQDVYHSGMPVVTQAEAQDLIARFTPLELNWQPLSTYLLSDGTTLGDYMASLDKPMSNSELHQFYADWFAELQGGWQTHYRILDINNDGKDDLLLSGDGDFYWNACTYRYGQLLSFPCGDFYLCENGVLEDVNLNHEDLYTEIVEHIFYTFDGYDRVELDYLAYNKATASWQSDRDGTPLSDAETQDILAKYPRIDQDMRPIRELLGN